ncbi:PCMD domain-containing protein [Flammeovirga sp. SubArs3]|uniref:PCMD domain-containing protein n=1 Tax=Flammeovirga sp. SubArs3 TaxID=2995316 RepID=UPI00248B0FBB|nr:PCMD domain-containing protein [Flammeovirga sp. SubArs3]
MKKLRLLIVSGLLMSLTSCIDWDYFGLSNQNDIQTFELEMQSGTTVIDSTKRIITVPVNERADRSSLSPTNIKTSSLSTVMPGVGESQDFRDTVLYTVTAENGDSSVWKVYADLQADVIPNTSFDEWYAVGGYQQPGPGDETAGAQFWDTPNKAGEIAEKTLVDPMTEGDRVYAHLETKLVGLFGINKLSAASLYSGRFTDGALNPSEPRKNIDFGRPYGSKPVSFSVDYQYTPGSDYRENSRPASGADECDIYVILQVRQDDGTRLRLGTAWFRSGDQIDEWTNLKIDFTYGELPSDAPDYAGLNTWEGEEESGYADPSEFPTHIIIVFSSSALGDYYTGAVESILKVDNFELQYD